MITKFKTLIDLCGCWENERAKEFFDSFNKEEITIYDILKSSEVSLSHKRWFVYNSCNLSRNQRLELAVRMGKSVAHLYNSKNEGDERVNECWKAIENFREGNVSREYLLEKSAAAYAAADDASASASASAAYDAYASAYAYYAASASAYAASAYAYYAAADDASDDASASASASAAYDASAYASAYASYAASASAAADAGSIEIMIKFFEEQESV